MRSDFLVHWTGKDICKYPNELDTGKRNNYVDRLVDILTYGFWMTVPTPVERVEGFADSWIEYKTPMTCFTEIRLSQAQEHSSRYGLLGVSVDRRFVLDRYGGQFIMFGTILKNASSGTCRTYLGTCRVIR